VGLELGPAFQESRYSFVCARGKPRRPQGGMTIERLRVFDALGLDEARMRTWAVIRGACLRRAPHEIAGLRALG
jgi:hypothetical protein